MAAAEGDVHKELKEELLVVEAKTIVHPRAVVVHSGDAVLADRTVVAHGRLDAIALFTCFGEYLFQERDDQKGRGKANVAAEVPAKVRMDAAHAQDNNKVKRKKNRDGES